MDGGIDGEVSVELGGEGVGVADVGVGIATDEEGAVDVGDEVVPDEEGVGGVMMAIAAIY